MALPFLDHDALVEHEQHEEDATKPELHKRDGE
jgi:hypothetical protein